MLRGLSSFDAAMGRERGHGLCEYRTGMRCLEVKQEYGGGAARYEVYCHERA